MSRTRKGSKPPGYEYWSARPLSGSPPGKAVKKMTHKIERQQNKRHARKEALQDA